MTIRPLVAQPTGQGARQEGGHEERPDHESDGHAAPAERPVDVAGQDGHDRPNGGEQRERCRHDEQEGR
jgi:hypothetical protein